MKALRSLTFKYRVRVSTPITLQVRVRPHRRRVPQRAEGFAPSVKDVAVQEAYEILQVQDHVIGYETEAKARDVQAGLLRKYNIRTDVVVRIGPPISEPHGRIEAEEYRRLGVSPGTHYVQYGLHHVRHEPQPEVP